jgi:hypothetical protein
MFYILINNLHFFIKVYFVWNLCFKKKLEKKEFLLDFSKNDSITPKSVFFRNNLFFISFNNKHDFKKILVIVSNLFFLNKNILFVDRNINYNYLPINNELIFNRTSNNLNKIIKYFNIALIFYLDLKKKKFIFKKLYACNLINVSVSSKLLKNKFDLNLDQINNPVYMYLLYVSVINMYLKIKNN